MREGTKVVVGISAMLGVLGALLGMSAGPGSIVVGLMIFLAGVVYMAPSITAIQRRHANVTAIVVLNLLTGWLVVTWVGAFVWAFTSNVLTDDEAPGPLNRAVTTAAREHKSRAEGAIGVWSDSVPPLPASAPVEPRGPKLKTDETTCPMCAEVVKKAARKCKHCGSELVPSA